MSQRLIDRNPDLKRLRDEGFNILVRDAYLIMKDVPYVNAAREIKRGVIVAALSLTNDKVGTPPDHTILFAGEYPCHETGTSMERIRHTESAVTVGDVRTTYSFSAKPKPHDNDPDYHTKMTRYAQILSAPAMAIDPDISAQTYPVYRNDEEEDDSVFLYADTASSRADIVSVTNKLKLDRVDVIGAGGTGGYIIDLVAKTPVREMHIWDGDVFDQHNAFRAPSAASGEELEERLKKVNYYARLYSKMRRGIVPHAEYVTAENAAGLQNSQFVFVCIEGPSKRPVVERLEALGIPFIDVGMGIYQVNGSLGGILRVTASTPAKREHVREKGRITFVGVDDVNEYDKNIQIADLNAMNAAMAVIKWKKLCGFYLDQEGEHFSTYTIGGNDIINEDQS
ncbi:ThiF family adenylyltransferase [Sphingobium sp. CCH11-B1]|jgi:hypothetical protein|uniref:ThiF family adenylyltransferase n=1 Tax=Sphingobium sp. CCH11-B1 TaxID=1768781 RepID=UPI00083335BA|nr:ThiF family adenylyltransferase [Sphingobium sp. CCH11-B1]